MASDVTQEGEFLNYTLYLGAQNTLNNLLLNWTDDNEANRKLAEALLAHAMLKTAGLT